MANKKFSEFVLKTSTSDVSHIVGYNGAENVQITPANFVTGGGTGVFLPLAGGTMTGNTIHDDNVKSIYGTSGDGLEIYHDGTHSYIKDTGTGDLKLQASNDIFLLDGSGNVMLEASENGSVDLFYNGAKKFETTNTGISVTGGGTFTGDLLIDTNANALLTLDGSTGSTEGIIIKHSGTEVSRISHSNSTNLVFSTGSSVTPVLTLDSSQNATFAGNVNIGDASNTKYFGSVVNLILNADSDGNSGTASRNIIFQNRGVETMRLDASGNLGIGTSSPSALLELSNINTSDYIKLTSASGGINPKIVFQKSATEQGVIQFIRNGDLKIYNTDDGGVMLSGSSDSDYDLYVKNGGNVGIGTSSPVSKLNVTTTKGSLSTQNSFLTLGLVIDDDSAFDTVGGGGGIAFRSAFNSAGVQNMYSAINSIKESANASDYRGTLAFYTNQNQTGIPLERMRINSAGNVGVGMTSGFNNVSGTETTVGILNSNVASLYLHSTATNGRKYGIYSASSGQLAFYDFTAGSERMRIDSVGNVMIGTTGVPSSGGFRFDASADSLIRIGHTTGTATGSNYTLFYLGSSVIGSISQNGTTGVSYNTSSDYRLKEDLQDFKGLDLVSKIPVYDYKWKADDSRSYGVMAHELKEVLPQAVTGDKDAEEMQSVDYSKIVPLLVKSIQELSAKLEALECQCEKK